MVLWRTEPISGTEIFGLCVAEKRMQVQSWEPSSPEKYPRDQELLGGFCCNSESLWAVTESSFEEMTHLQGHSGKDKLFTNLLI